jgi:hypothetical protein
MSITVEIQGNRHGKTFKCDDCRETYQNCECRVYMSAYRPGGSLDPAKKEKRPVGGTKRREKAFWDKAILSSSQLEPVIDAFKRLKTKLKQRKQ